MKCFRDNYEKCKAEVATSEDKVKKLTTKYNDDVSKMQSNYVKIEERVCEL